jgi:hypothetical protein
LKSRASVLASAALLSPLLAPSQGAAAPECAQIEEGDIRNSDGTTVTVGEDPWGYDFQERTFQGGYCESMRTHSCSYAGVELAMVWNEAWLSHQDCDRDRHYGFASYRGSGAELVDAMHGRTTQDGKACEWFYYVRYVAAPLDARLQNGYWIASDGSVLGAVIWNEFAVAQTSYNTVCFDGDPPPTE